MYFLIREATDKENAKDLAESEIESLFENGDLVEGDIGHVYIEGPEEEYPLLSAEEDIEEFILKLQDLNFQRRERAAQYFRDVAAGMQRDPNLERLEDIPVLESLEIPDSIHFIAHDLSVATDIVRRVWTDRGVLWNVNEYLCGVTQGDLNEIRKNPKGIYLVPVVVG